MMSPAPARMSPERFDELTRRITSDLWCGSTVDRELLDALTAERERAQQVEIPHASAAVLGYLLQVHGKDTVFTVGQDGFDAPYPTLDAAQEAAGQFKNMTVTVFAAVRVGADGRIGS